MKEGKTRNNNTSVQISSSRSLFSFTVLHLWADAVKIVVILSDDARSNFSLPDTLAVINGATLIW